MKTLAQRRCDRRMIAANKAASALGVGSPVESRGVYCWLWKTKLFCSYQTFMWAKSVLNHAEKNGLEIVVTKPETIRQIIGPDAKGVPARYMAFLMTGEVPKELCFVDDIGE